MTEWRNEQRSNPTVAESLALLVYQAGQLNERLEKTESAISALRVSVDKVVLRQSAHEQKTRGIIETWSAISILRRFFIALIAFFVGIPVVLQTIDYIRGWIK
jgi:hypothetical protein